MYPLSDFGHYTIDGLKQAINAGLVRVVMENGQYFIQPLNHSRVVVCK